MVVVPAVPPVTTPIPLTLATVVLLLLHVPPVTPSPKVVPRPKQTDVAPDIEPGAAITVNVVAAGVPQPVV